MAADELQAFLEAFYLQLDEKAPLVHAGAVEVVGVAQGGDGRGVGVGLVAAAGEYAAEGLVMVSGGAVLAPQVAEAGAALE
ncbi:MAG: hypothetical protein U5L11_02635 [Arhodomonas sp.]|nr:hypothetical protein [Arhodomonas sp.]